MSDNKTHLHYLTHKNGRGKLYDLSEACELSFLDRSSSLDQESSAWRSRIEQSKVIDSVISDSVIKGSVIEHSIIHGGIITASHIACEYVGGNVRISNSTVLGKSRVAHSARLENVHFKNLTVKGNAVLRDWNNADEIFDGAFGYITRGVWTRPPRIFKISPTITITESVPGFAFVHCRELSLGRWLKIGTRYGLQCNWTRDEILATRRIFHYLRDRVQPL